MADVFESYEKYVKANEEPIIEKKEDEELFELEEVHEDKTPPIIEEKEEPKQSLFDEEALIDKITSKILSALEAKAGDQKEVMNNGNG